MAGDRRADHRRGAPVRSCSGLALASLVLVFATFNTVVDHYRLLRMVPAAFYHAAVVAAIALTFVPQMVASLQDIREAQALRGHRFRGLRDLLPCSCRC